jgi:hypothetical protein
MKTRNARASRVADARRRRRMAIGDREIGDPRRSGDRRSKKVVIGSNFDKRL